MKLIAGLAVSIFVGVLIGLKSKNLKEVFVWLVSWLIIWLVYQSTLSIK